MSDWLIRPDPNDEFGYEINLEADPDAKVPMVVGEVIGGRQMITETRMYTIRELRKMLSD